MTYSEDFSMSADDRAVDGEDEFDVSEFDSLDNDYDFEEDDQDEAAAARHSGH